jgi:hypothetical protein
MQQGQASKLRSVWPVAVREITLVAPTSKPDKVKGKRKRGQ